MYRQFAEKAAKILIEKGFIREIDFAEVVKELLRGFGVQ
jgi:hypothetical protein